MGIEIERKFLVVGDAWKAGVSSAKAIRQGYLSLGGAASVRVRIVDGVKGTLTIKSARAGIERQEFEYPIPTEDAEALLALSVANVIAKRRHVVPVPGSGLVWEVDVFEGRLAGLVLAEIEFDAAHRDIVPPAWVGREVTDDERYYNETLARLPDLSAITSAVPD